MDQNISEKPMSLSRHLETADPHVEKKARAEDVELASPSMAHMAKVEKRVVLKQDLTIVLLLAGCYFFAYLVCSFGRFPRAAMWSF